MKNIIAIGAFLFTAALYSQNNQFTVYDRNGNNTVEKEEFIDVYKKEMNSRVQKMGGKNDLSREEFYKKVFVDLDRNRDNNLDREEWDAALEYLYRDYLSSDYLLTDKDRNKVIDYDEYYEQVYQTDYFTYWDVNKDLYLNDMEQAEAVFTAFDSNDDGLLEKDEFDRYNSFYMRDGK